LILAKDKVTHCVFVQILFCCMFSRSAILTLSYLWRLMAQYTRYACIYCAVTWCLYVWNVTLVLLSFWFDNHVRGSTGHQICF